MRPSPPRSHWLRRRLIVRGDGGLWCYERALRRAGFHARGRGRRGGPGRLCRAARGGSRRAARGTARGDPGLADSKLLTAEQRELAYERVIARATAWSVCVIPTADVDRRGVHQANVAGMRRAVARLSILPCYTLTDGFPIPGMPSPSCAVWKGDQVVGCVAAASVVAKVTRDRMMRELDGRYPQYGFAASQGLLHARARCGSAWRTARAASIASRSSTSRRAAAANGGGDRFATRPVVIGQDDEMADFARSAGGSGVSAEDLEKYETEMELQLYREYRDVVGLFTYVIETERRFYLANDYRLDVRGSADGEVFFELSLHDAWVWDMYRPARFVKNVRVVTFKDVNVEEITKAEL